MAQTAQMREECGAKLTKLAAWLKEHPTVGLRLARYVDQVEVAWPSAALAGRRATVVREALIAAGVEPTRIETLAPGNWLRCEESTADSCPLWNRRVEVMAADAPTGRATAPAREPAASSQGR